MTMFLRYMLVAQCVWPDAVLLKYIHACAPKGGTEERETLEASPPDFLE